MNNDAIIRMVQAQVKQERFERFRESKQLSLGALIRALEKFGFNAEVRFDTGAFPGRVTSWRGSYDELAITFHNVHQFNVFGDFLHELQSAIGKTFTGYKGGEFTMDEYTPVWVSGWGDADNLAPVGVHLEGNVVVIETDEFEY